MANAKATFEVELEDQTSAPAEDAAAALERLKAKILSAQQELRDMTAAMGRLKGSSVEVVAQKKALQDRIASVRSSLASSQAQFLKLGGNLGDLSKKAAGVVEGTKGLGEALQQLGGPMGDVIQKGEGLLAVLASPAGIAFAIGVVGVIALAAGVALFALAVKMADAARSARIYLTALAGSEAGGAALARSIDQVARRVALARAELQAIASELRLAGIQGEALTQALESVATVQATIGAGPASKLKAALEQAAKTGKVVVKGLEEIGFEGEYTFKQLQDAIRKRFGEAARAQLLSLPNLIQRLKEGFSGIFAGLKIDPVLKVLADVVGLLDQSTASGKALRRVAEVVFQPMIDFVGKHGRVFTAFFKGIVIAVLLVVLVILKVKNALKSAFGGDALKGIDGFKVALAAGVGIGLAFAVMLGVVGLALVLLAAFVLLPVVAIIALGAAFKLAYDQIKGMSWSEIGTSIIRGLVSAITGGASEVIAALAGVAKKALAAAKKELGIASPSKAFMLVGHQITEGMTKGVEDGAPSVEGAVEGMGEAAIGAATAARSGPRAGADRAAAAGVTINGLHVHVEGVRDVEDFKIKLRPALIDVLRSVLKGGAMPPLQGAPA